MATFGDNDFARGMQQYEAIGYQRGADGKPHTADDVELGPVGVTWSLEIFYETDTSKQARVGTISPTGFFMPAAVNPGTNFDVWVVATYQDTENGSGNGGGTGPRPLKARAHLLVTVPLYLRWEPWKGDQ